jgi:hypothetical protein
MEKMPFKIPTNHNISRSKTLGAYNLSAQVLPSVFIHVSSSQLDRELWLTLKEGT